MFFSGFKTLCCWLNRSELMADVYTEGSYKYSHIGFDWKGLIGVNLMTYWVAAGSAGGERRGTKSDPDLLITDKQWGQRGGKGGLLGVCMYSIKWVWDTSFSYNNNIPVSQIIKVNWKVKLFYYKILWRAFKSLI